MTEESQLLQIFERWLPNTSFYKSNEKRWKAQSKVNHRLTEDNKSADRDDELIVSELVRQYFDTSLKQASKQHITEMAEVERQAKSDLTTVDQQLQALQNSRIIIERLIKENQGLVDQATELKADAQQLAEKANGHTWSPRQLAIKAIQFGIVGLFTGLLYSLGGLIVFGNFGANSWTIDVIILAIGVVSTTIIAWVISQHRIALLLQDYDRTVVARNEREAEKQARGQARDFKRRKLQQRREAKRERQYADKQDVA